MPYLSLYRKYRPRTFAEVVGQRHVTQTLTNAVKAGRIAHAYLFCGPRGTGKTSTARALAMALNCEKGQTAEPCLECESCRRITAGSALDVIEIDAASNRGIDEIRDLREKVALAPADARMKVYIIDEVHMLTGEAFNAFLKTLEEPPAHVVFVLATTEPHRVLPTILSRCQRFDFHRISVGDIEATVRMIAGKEGLEVDDTAVAMLAHAADGSVRDALTLLDQAAAYAEGRIGPEVITEILGGIDFDLLAEFTDVFSRREVAAALSLLDRVVAEGKDLRQLLLGLIGHYRNLLLLSVDRRGAEALALPAEVVKKTVEQAKSLGTEEIIRTLDLLAETDRELRFTSQPRLLVELCAVRMCREPAREAASPREAGAGAEAAAPEPPAARPEAQPEAREEAAEEPGSIGEMKRRWDEVIADLRKRKEPSVAAFVHEAMPVELEEEVLTVAFNHQFHYDQMVKDEKRQQVLSEAVERVTGQTLRIKCRLVGEKEPPKGKPSTRPAGKRQAEPVEDLMSLFPGSQVEE
jgi:DNA polymerase-3 subunit gamma/tau